jgi:hypothetical protein
MGDEVMGEGGSVTRLLKGIAVTTGTLVSLWCAFMFAYAHPTVAARGGWLDSGVGLIVVLGGLAALIGFGSKALAGRIGLVAWVLVPVIVTISCFSLLFVSWS